MSSLGFTIVVGALLTVSSAVAQEVERPVVVTRGRGVVHAAPDLARVTIASESRAGNPRQAQDQTAVAMASVQSALEGARIPETAIRTLSFDLQPEFDYQGGQQRLRGYVARNTIEVRLDDIERAGEVIDLAVASGATAVTGVRFDVKERAALEREALRLAVSDARARADAAASGAGRTIAAVLRIEEGGALRQQPPVRLAMRADAAAAPQTPIAPGEIEVVATVTLTAALE